ncbi:hypothetical protein PQG83_07890 [Candidatus Nitrospira neomarina]|uniref:Uncharacterized protein n=1 Tax=Candidatus Nitrospira neomarina TaxID=3020899 RepID=A0AA96GT99_9BACT|nr:hypothetical protein PQG83_07890 [Candidatus Nitrospira neomarina]
MAKGFKYLLLSFRGVSHPGIGKLNPNIDIVLAFQTQDQYFNLTMFGKFDGIAQKVE